MRNSRSSGKSLTEDMVELLLAEKFDDFRRKMAELDEAIYPTTYKSSVIIEAVERLASTGNISCVNLLIDEFGGDHNEAAVCYAHYHHTDALQQLLSRTKLAGKEVNQSMLACEYAQQGQHDKVEELLKSGKVKLEELERGYRSGGFTKHADKIAEQLARDNLIKNTALKIEILTNLYRNLHAEKHLHAISNNSDTVQLYGLLQDSDLVQKLIEPKLITTRKVHAIINEINQDYVSIIQHMNTYNLSFETALYFHILDINLMLNGEASESVMTNHNADITREYLEKLASTLGLSDTNIEHVMPIFNLKYTKNASSPNDEKQTLSFGLFQQSDHTPTDAPISNTKALTN